MATEVKIVRRAVRLPRGTAVDIPVLERVPFVVAAEQYQERIMYFRNGDDANRKVHVHDVPSRTNPSDTIPVERIDRCPIITAAEQYQERNYYFKNLDPPPVQPDGSNDPQHEKVHYVRYFPQNDQNSDSWIDVELIDKCKIICAAEQYQEWMVYLKHAAAGDPIEDPEANYGPITAGFVDPSLPEISQAPDTPWRFDPFQNIIAFDEAGTFTEPYDYEWFCHIPNVNMACGSWTMGFYSAPAINSGSARDNIHPYPTHDVAGEYIFGGEFDLRFVDQPFEPHTYEPPTASTADIRGFTRYEWQVGWTPSNNPLFGNPSWYDQMVAYWATGSPLGSPNTLEYEPYGFHGELCDLYHEAEDSYRNLPYGQWKFFYVRVRLAALGPNTTDNPLGRY